MESRDPAEGLPQQVARLQEVFAATSRLVILRELLTEPLTFGQLSGRSSLSLAALRAALVALTEAGYVSDDSPAGRRRKSSGARFSVDRERVLRDAAELLLFLAV